MANTLIQEVKTVDLTGTAAKDLLEKFTTAKNLIKQAETAKAEAEAALRELLGDAEVAVADGEKIFKLQHSSNSKFDRALMMESFPEAYEATYVKVPYTFIKEL